MLKRAAEVDLTYVPYSGGAPAINALLGGHVTSVFAEYAPLAEHLRAGVLRALATRSRGSRPYRNCQRSQNPAMRVTRWICGGACLLRRRRRVPASANWRAGSAQRYELPMSTRSLSDRASHRSAYAVNSFAHSFVNSMNSIAVSSGKRRSASERGKSGNAASNAVGRSKHARVGQLEEHLITNQRACRFESCRAHFIRV
jgi:Tripartite tricarboxylate transporter family receptor